MHHIQLEVDIAKGSLMHPVPRSQPLGKNPPRKAAENHWLIYLLVVSPVLFRATRYAISMATRGAAEPLSILEIGLLLAVLYQVFVRWLFLRQPPVVLCRSDAFVLLFVLAAALSVVAILYEPVDHTETLKAFVRLMEYVALYMIVSTNIRSWQAIKKLMVCLVGCGVAVSLLAIIQYILGPLTSTDYFPWGTWWNAFDFAASFRAYSFFSNTLYVVAYLSIVWPINLGLLVGERGSKNRLPYLAALLLNSVAVLLTFSRSAVVGLAVALFVFAKERARFAIAGGVAVLLIGSYLMPEELRVRLFLESRESRESILGRFERYEEALSLYATHPLFGVGIGNYLTYYSGGVPQVGERSYFEATPGAINSTTWLRRDYQRYTAENTFLQYSGEMGTIGILAFLALCVHFLTLLWKLRKKYAASDVWVVGLFAGLLGFLACSMFTTLTAVEMNSAFWLLLGISKALWLRRPRTEPEVRSV